MWGSSEKHVLPLIEAIATQLETMNAHLSAVDARLQKLEETIATHERQTKVTHNMFLARLQDVERLLSKFPWTALSRKNPLQVSLDAYTSEALGAICEFRNQYVLALHLFEMKYQKVAKWLQEVTVSAQEMHDHLFPHGYREIDGPQE